MASPAPRSTPLAWYERLSDAKLVSGDPREISDVTSDSRRVERGGLFVAVPGFDVDGHAYIGDALQHGASALLVQRDHQSEWERFAGQTTVISVPDTRQALALAAAAFFGEPGRKLGVIGVTGTDGKTTTVHLIAHVLESAGRPSGYLSSVAFKTGAEAKPNASHMTTLEAPDIQAHLADMVSSGVQYAVVEASSHGLALHRVDECAFDVGVFTTLSRDHLDFHQTMEAYRDAKGRLFRMLDESPAKDGVAKAAVLNADDSASDYFRTLTRSPVLTYSLDAAGDVLAERLESVGLTSRFRLRSAAGGASVTLPLAGRYNVANALAATAVAISQGISLGEVVQGIEASPGVPGRMEAIDCGQGFRVIVDIASTPEALRRVLDVLRPVTDGKLIAVFGCAGERDPARREGMGRVAAEVADFTVLTNEDPRREDPDTIIEEIATVMRASGRSEGDDFARVPDRREAIRSAFERARPGDTVLLAGKATEQSIIIGTTHHSWDERCVARELLQEVTGKERST